MATYASFTIRHPARPDRIGSGNSRLGNPSPINLRSMSRASNQLLPVGWTEPAPSSSPQKSTNNAPPPPSGRPHHRHAEEVAAGLHDKKGKKAAPTADGHTPTKRRGRPAQSATPTEPELF